MAHYWVQRCIEPNIYICAAIHFGRNPFDATLPTPTSVNLLRMTCRTPAENFTDFQKIHSTLSIN
jgi:hypothetical protein